MHDKIKQLKIVLIGTAVLIAIASLMVSQTLVEDLSEKERQNMEVWSEAMRALSHADETTDLSLVLRVINGNDYIPVVVMNENQEVLDYRNIEIEASSMNDSLEFVQRYARDLAKRGNLIHISASSEVEGGGSMQLYVVYDESLMLQRLTHYPYIQLGVIGLFVVMAIFALLASKRAEQEKVWVGLSRETAHQLGTPISSLMAWNAILQEAYKDDPLILEMNTDIQRLQLIAERFSKIGSKPEVKEEDLCEVINRVVGYIGKRVSDKVRISCSYPDLVVKVPISASLFEWVIENLCKNAIDAMQGVGEINIYVYRHADMLKIEITDTGMGIPKDKFKTIFQPGYTTKKRGWGLGLSLAKRIVEDYHKGRIYVKCSSRKGTTFVIEIKLRQC